jgi:hypothetical protein
MTDKPTRRVRGNSTPPEEDPIKFWIPDPEPEQQKENLWDFVLALAIIVAFLALFIVGLGLI